MEKKTRSKYLRRKAYKVVTCEIQFEKMWVASFGVVVKQSWSVYP